MSTPRLQNFTPDTFLRRYWQQRPLLVRNALPNVPYPLEPEELAGLACEKQVFSRIVLERGGKKPWEVRRGPFKPAQFRTLPKSHWTLLVNGVDSLLPEVNALFDYFSFLPSWRLDDIMISYATRGGNVGAHVDNYDVFLIQVAGKREWRISETPLLEDDFKEGLDVKLLKTFHPTKRYVLEPGDMLYLPPRVPHHGISLDNGCMTYSVGFRAPGYQEMLDSLATHAMAAVDESDRFSDPKLKPQHPGELSLEAVKKIRLTLFALLFNDKHFSRWLGEYLTEPCDPDISSEGLALPFQALRSASSAGAVLVREEGARLLYLKENRQLKFFVNGSEHSLPLSGLTFVKALTARVRSPLEATLSKAKSSKEKQLFTQLLREGIFRLE